MLDSTLTKHVLIYVLKKGPVHEISFTKALNTLTMFINVIANDFQKIWTISVGKLEW